MYYGLVNQILVSTWFHWGFTLVTSPVLRAFTLKAAVPVGYTSATILARIRPAGVGRLHLCKGS